MAQVNTLATRQPKLNKEEEGFFKAQTPSSRIKANIVAEYFPAYAKILLKYDQREVRYLDLFAGPGKYEDGNLSTPLLLADTCASDALLSKKVQLAFNDNLYSAELEVNFLTRFPEGTFQFRPRFGSCTVGEDDRIRNYLSRPPQLGVNNPHPTLLFFDPWGYKGIDTLILAKFLAHWGNELFLFINIKRIHAAILNDKFDDLMRSLFPTTIEQLRHDRKYTSTVHERLSLIMEHLASEFKNAVGPSLYSCAFKFQEEDSIATSHYIIHFTKHPKGYELIKQTYYGFDNIGATLEKDGDYTFDAKQMDGPAIGSIFGDLNISSLAAMLEAKYAGQKIPANALFREHNLTTKFAGSHYVKALRELYDQQKLDATFTDGKQHKKSVLLTEHCILEFK